MALSLAFQPFNREAWIRINQLGYLPESVKVAVFISTDDVKPENFVLCDTATGKEVLNLNEALK